MRLPELPGHVFRYWLCLNILGHVPEANLAKELYLSLDVYNELGLKTVMNSS